MVYLEKFTGWNKISENNDDVDIQEDIHSICKRYLIENYTVNPDGTIDVNGVVDLSREDLTKIPIKFGRVSDNFYCDYNRLSSLEGCPSYVGGDFLCGDNRLTSLVGGPIEISGSLFCNNNKLSSLEGGPIYVGEGFNCDSNFLTTLVGAPEKVGGNFYCRSNRLLTLDGLPREIGGDFGCIKNPVHYIYEFFGSISDFMDSLDWNYIRGNEIIRARFADACAEVGISVPPKIKGYKYI